MIKCVVCVINFDPSDVLHTRPQEFKSRLVKCRTCFGIYAVLRPQLLNVNPKCYPCRMLQSSTKSTCSKCQNQFICNDAPFTLCKSCSLNIPYLLNVVKVRKDELFQQNQTCLNISFELYTKLKRKKFFSCICE